MVKFFFLPNFLILESEPFPREELRLSDEVLISFHPRNYVTFDLFCNSATECTALYAEFLLPINHNFAHWQLGWNLDTRGQILSALKILTSMSHLPKSVLHWANPDTLFPETEPHELVIYAAFISYKPDTTVSQPMLTYQFIKTLWSLHTNQPWFVSHGCTCLKPSSYEGTKGKRFRMQPTSVISLPSVQTRQRRHFNDAAVMAD